MAESSAAQHYTLQLTCGLSTSDLAWLTRPDLYSNFFVFDGLTNSVDNPVAGSVPWPVALLLGSKSRKFRFCFRHSYDARRYRSSIAELKNKLLWSWYYRGDSGTGGARKWAPRVTPAYPHIVDTPAAILTFAKSLKTKLWELSPFSCLRRYDNLPLYFRFARRWLKHNNFTVDPSDKDGTMVLIKTVDLARLRNNKIDGDHYYEVPTHSRARESFRPLSYSSRPRASYSAKFRACR